MALSCSTFSPGNCPFLSIFAHVLPHPELAATHMWLLIPVHSPRLPGFTLPLPPRANVFPASVSTFSWRHENVAIDGCWLVSRSCRSADLAIDIVHLRTMGPLVSDTPTWNIVGGAGIPERVRHPFSLLVQMGCKICMGLPHKA